MNYLEHGARKPTVIAGKEKYKPLGAIPVF